MTFSIKKRSFATLVLAGAIALSAAGCSSTASTPSAVAGTSAQPAAATPTSDNYADKIILVWYPNESAADYEPARNEIASLISEATGKEVEHKLTTDYSIAIESGASGTAQICFMGAQGYIEANKKNGSVQPLIVNSGSAGTLDGAIYYSWFAVNTGDEAEYQDGGKYSIEHVEGKRMSFVSSSSTSGFTNAILTLFGATENWKDITVDDLVEGGADKFFSEVLFGGSHQGSAVNLLTGKADVAAFCDTEMAPYMSLASGEESTAGAVYEVNSDASAPFDTLAGKQCVIIKSTPVLNGPFAYNADTLSPDDVKAIQDLFTSDTVSDDPLIFVTKDSGNVGMFKKSDKECFLLVDDSWYDPIRNME
jgi:phosphonate transport system substrate-binding protein